MTENRIVALRVGLNHRVEYKATSNPPNMSIEVRHSMFVATLVFNSVSASLSSSHPVASRLKCYPRSP